MNDDPFKNQLEDYLNKGIRAGVTLLPIWGGPLGEFLSFAIGDPAQERRDAFLRDVCQRLMGLESRYEAVRPENLAKNEAFQATFIQASQASLRTAEAEKKKMLRNAILNAAIGTIDETVRQMFMQYIDRLTAMHVALLKLFDDPSRNAAAKTRAGNMMAAGLTIIVEAAIPSLKGQDALASVLVNDLEAMKLANGVGLNTTMSAQGLLQRRTTDLGRSFLAFVSDPTTQAE